MFSSGKWTQYSPGVAVLELKTASTQLTDSKLYSELSTHELQYETLADVLRREMENGSKERRLFPKMTQTEGSLRTAGGSKQQAKGKLFTAGEDTPSNSDGNIPLAEPSHLHLTTPARVLVLHELVTSNFHRTKSVSL